MSANDLYRICASRYDADYRAVGREEDLAFWTDLAHRLCPPTDDGPGGPILELGCGTGRVTLPLARAGFAVSAVDASPDMLGRLRQNLAEEDDEVAERVQPVLADGRRAEMPGGPFPLVLAPFRVVQHLVGVTDQRAFLSVVRRHLAPGASFVFDVFQPDYAVIGGGTYEATEDEHEDPETGRPVRRHIRAVQHPERQVLELTVRWVATDGEADNEGGGEVLATAGPTPVRWFTRFELEHLLARDGLEVAEVWGDFEGNPHGPGASEIIVRAVPAG